MVKQRQESARTYEEGGRLDLAERELNEITVIEEFLPKQLDEAETVAAIEAAIAETGAGSIRDMGKVMGALKTNTLARWISDRSARWSKTNFAGPKGRKDTTWQGPPDGAALLHCGFVRR